MGVSCHRTLHKSRMSPGKDIGHLLRHHINVPPEVVSCLVPRLNHQKLTHRHLSLIFYKETLWGPISFRSPCKSVVASLLPCPMLQLQGVLIKHREALFQGERRLRGFQISEKEEVNATLKREPVELKRGPRMVPPALCKRGVLSPGDLQGTTFGRALCPLCDTWFLVLFYFLSFVQGFIISLL